MLKKFPIILSALFLLTIATYSHAQVPNQPSLSRVAGNQLLLQKRLPDGQLASETPYVIKGVTWQAATTADSFFWGDPAPFLAWLKTEPASHYLQDIPLMKQMNVNTVRVYNDFGTNDVAFRKILDEFYKNDIMVVMTVLNSKKEIEDGKYLTMINKFKDHPAVLMWALGNEWNFQFHLFYGYTTVAEATAKANEVAGIIKSDLNDPHHAVTSALGDRFSEGTIMRDIVRGAPNVDIWGLNIYRGTSFNSPQGNLFTQWTNLWAGATSKPFYLSEFGTDSLKTTFRVVVDGYKADNITGDEDQILQADTDENLWKLVKARLASSTNTELCVGGFVHEFNEEWWKVGNPHLGLDGINDFPDSYRRQDKEGVLGGHPDGVANEEYFGVVTAARDPKEAFARLTAAFAETKFVRGDANCDGAVNIADAVFILEFLFRDGAAPGCMDGADTNDDSIVDISDAVKLLFVLFTGSPMPAPYPAPGVDPTADALSCTLACPAG